MSPSILSTYTVPAVLKYEFNVEKVTNFLGHNALKCAPSIGDHAFYLYMTSDNEETEPFLHIHYMTTDSEEILTHPVYPFNAADMPEKVQGLINMAEQWLTLSLIHI